MTCPTPSRHGTRRYVSRSGIANRSGNPVSQLDQPQPVLHVAGDIPAQHRVAEGEARALSPLQKSLRGDALATGVALMVVPEDLDLTQLAAGERTLERRPAGAPCGLPRPAPVLVDGRASIMLTSSPRVSGAGSEGCLTRLVAAGAGIEMRRARRTRRTG